VNPLSLSLEGRDPSIWGIGVKRAIHNYMEYMCAWAAAVRAVFKPAWLFLLIVIAFCTEGNSKHDTVGWVAGRASGL